MTLGQRIKQARLARGLTLDEVAERMGIGAKSRQLVWQWERFPGRRSSDPRKHIEKLCVVLGVPLDHFYGDEPQEDSGEAKFRRLDPDDRGVIEATMDAMLARRVAAARPKRKPKPKPKS